MLLRIRQGEYGPVRVVEGEYAGRVGYYDADEGPLAVIYFTAPLMSEAVLIRRSWLRPTNVIPPDLVHWQHASPAIVEPCDVTF
jgi:hypothetical protein